MNISESNTIICGTGHRPNKLGGYSIEVFNKLVEVIEEFLTKHRPKMIISGMAIGFDQALVQAAMNLGVPFIAAIPCNNQDITWPQHVKERYAYMLSKAEKIHQVCKGGYQPIKMQIRNEWMVDNAHFVLALWDGSSGGTGNCIKYANRKSVNKPIINLWSSWVGANLEK
jgi:uncharacterized phage-like protein YoqJ